MNLRLLSFAFLLISLAAPAAFSQSTVRLKPFQSGGPGTQTSSLAGAWKGTFIFDRKDNGGKEAVAFLVEVPRDFSALTMTALPPFSSDPDTRISPVTDGAVPADWDGELLKAHTERTFQDGRARVLIVKKYVLRPGNDGRHAGVSYEVTVKTSLPHDERTNTVRGTGELVRVR